MTTVLIALGGLVLVQCVVLGIVVRYLLKLSTAVACEELHALSTDHKLEELTDELTKRRRQVVLQQLQRRHSLR